MITRKSKSPCGAALIELVLLLPLFIIITTGVLTVGKGLREYLKTVRTCYEGLRFAMVKRDLPVDKCFGDECATTDPITPEIAQIVDRTKKLLVEHGIATPPSITIWIRKAGAPSESYREITFRIRVPFKSAFPLFGLGRLTTTISSSDLQPNI